MMDWVAFRSSWVAHFNDHANKPPLIDAINDLDAPWLRHTVCSNLALFGLFLGVYRPRHLEKIVVAWVVSAMGLALADTLGVPADFRVPLTQLLAATVALHARFGYFIVFWLQNASVMLHFLPSSMSSPHRDAAALLYGAGFVFYGRNSVGAGLKAMERYAPALVAVGLILLSVLAYVGPLSKPVLLAVVCSIAVPLLVRPYQDDRAQRAKKHD
ncbi:hypothetical protein SDRG_14321 [Saprolegnia diclina VS20]|uniref:Uncharacterized protein n=1 Tax=Saprolegnia diclina (strain VS20) TaxID=1156394 RepID=T0Q3C0_SAPDV|nr:hypothetical protein SDRG_14321 [Saprolegnia diclina VS20]EQC27900.1 hypothetical protein SDRG_14321 [Saprolegnia diclina VS20]|eukprot:XP_008618665.1 hypothetical protein SDRG_14321 [Saprolegnia diclina VS20]